MSELPDWVKKWKKKGIEIRNLRGRYYAYEMSSVYDTELKRAKKITGKYLGVVTQNGIVKRSAASSSIYGDFEYGNIALLYGIAEKTITPILKRVFPYMYERILIYALIRLINPLPMKSMRYQYEKTYLSRISGESMAPASISGMLSSLPAESMIQAMKEMTREGEYILMDSTAIFSRSVNIGISEIGHNSHEVHMPQINLMMLFSFSRKEHTFIRVIPGSIRDVSTMAATMDLAGVEKCVIIADKGFYSSENVKRLKTRHLSFIIPLKRNSSLIPGEGEFSGVFDYDGKPVKYWNPVNSVYVFEDPVLRMEEEKDFLERVRQGKRSRKHFTRVAQDFGKLHLLSDLRENPERIYRLYKEREYVEYAFNVYKNDLEADRSYLRDERMLSSYMFLNLLSLHIHFQILNRISGKYSVRDVLLILSRIKIYSTTSGEILSEIPKKANDLVSELKIDLDILRKK